MNRKTICALALLLPAGLAPSAGLAAQELEIAPFLSRNGGLHDAPALVGLAATWYPMAVGLRGSGSMDLPSSPLASLVSGSPSGARAWTGDLDLVLSGRRAGVPLRNVDVLVFAGAGVHGLRWPDGFGGTAMVWSYGGGVAVPLASRLSLALEARYRMPHESRPERLPVDVAGGLELRSGLALRLGSPPGGVRPGAGRAGTLATPAGVPAPRLPADVVARSMVLTGQEHLGTRYVWGGSSPSEGFDCSGFVQYVYARNGVRLPRVSRDQARAGQRVSTSLSNLKPGDLLFFAGSGGVVDHVAIYVGDRTILHASSRRGQVVYDHLDSPSARWYVDNLVAVRRVIP